MKNCDRNSATIIKKYFDEYIFRAVGTSNFIGLIG